MCGDRFVIVDEFGDLVVEWMVVFVSIDYEFGVEIKVCGVKVVLFLYLVG